MPTQNEKLTKVVQGLFAEIESQQYAYDCSCAALANAVHMKVEDYEGKFGYEPFKPFTVQKRLRQVILSALDYADRHAVYIMIDRLLGKGLIRNNPTSQLSAQKHRIMPSNDTRYFLDVEKITDFIKSSTTHTTTTLDHFNRKATSSNGLSEIPSLTQPSNKP